MVLRSAYYFFKLAQHGATEITTILKLVKIEIEKKKKKDFTKFRTPTSV